MDIQEFINQFKQTFVYDTLSQTLTDEQLFSHSIDSKNGEVIWFKEQMRQMWAMCKAVTVPNTQALHDRLLVKSITEHVDSHLEARHPEADLFDKGWNAAMRCVRHNIEALEENQ